MRKNDLMFIGGLTLAFAGLAYFSTKSVVATVGGAAHGIVTGVILASALKVLQSESISLKNKEE
jgi:hypothetical protein